MWSHCHCGNSSQYLEGRLRVKGVFGFFAQAQVSEHCKYTSKKRVLPFLTMSKSQEQFPTTAFV